MVNESGNEIKLRKGDDLGVLRSLEIVVADCEKVENGLNLAEIDCGDIGVDEKAKLDRLLVKYDDSMKSSTERKIPVEHEIKLIDEIPVSLPPRRVPFSQREEIGKQVEKWKQEGNSPLSIEDFREHLNTMYAMERSKMETRQKISASYYDQKEENG